MAGRPNKFWRSVPAVAAAAALGAELWLAGKNWRAFSSAERLVAQRRQECRALEGRQPAGTATGQRKLEAETARIAARVAGLEARFAVPGARDVAAPASSAGPRTDAFFDLAGFARSMREAAKLAGVEVGPEETFGFSARAADGIRPDDLKRVRRQRRAAVRLLTALWRAHPRRFVALQRTEARRSMKASAKVRSRRSKDEAWHPDPRLAAITPEGMETDDFRLTFAGDTAALRRFLNAAAAEEWPLVVRGLTAEPEAGAGRATAAKSGDPLALVVRPKMCRFTVTLESCVLSSPPGASDAAGPTDVAAAAPTLVGPAWPTPPSSSPMGGRRYELFTPPSIYFDRNSGRLMWVTGAESRSGSGVAPDLELLAVRPGPFRWQLAGYAWGNDGLYGVFLDTEAGGTELRGEGADLDGGYTVAELTVRRGRAGGNPDESEDWAEATVVDASTGARIAVTSRRRCLAGPPLGLFAHRGEPEFRRELREGESLALDGVEYCVERLDLAPARAVVARASAGAVRPDLITLVPPAGRRDDETPRSATPDN